jgi:hypothetical protein
LFGARGYEENALNNDEFIYQINAKMNRYGVVNRDMHMKVQDWVLSKKFADLERVGAKSPKNGF